MDYNNPNDPNYRPDRTDRVVETTETTVVDDVRPYTSTTVVEAAKPVDHTGTWITAVVVVIVLAFGGYYFYANSTGQPIFAKETMTNSVDASKAAVTPDKPASGSMK